MPLPRIAPEVPASYGQHVETYSLGCIAHVLWKRKVLRDAHWLDAGNSSDSLTDAITRAVEEVISPRLLSCCKLGRYNLVWTDNMNSLPGLQCVAPLGAFAIIQEDEPQMYVVGYALWDLNNSHPGVGTAIYTVLSLACEWTLAGMTPSWAKAKAREWSDIYNDEFPAGEENDDELVYYGANPKEFDQKLPHFVHTPPHFTKRTITRLQSALDSNRLSPEHKEWIDLAIRLATVLRRKRAINNFVWTYAGNPQLPGVGLAWLSEDDPCFRIFDEYIDEFRQCGDPGENVFVVPFDRSLYPEKKLSVVAALEHIADAIEAASLTLTLCNLLSNATGTRNSPRRQRVRVGASLSTQFANNPLATEEGEVFVDRL